MREKESESMNVSVLSAFIAFLAIHELTIPLLFYGFFIRSCKTPLSPCFSGDCIMLQTAFHCLFFPFVCLPQFED